MTKENQITQEIILKQFELQTSDLWEHFVEELTRRIDYHLRFEFEKLLQICYRMDIDEMKFREALTQEKNPAATLALLFIKRAQKKAQYRLKYS